MKRGTATTKNSDIRGKQEAKKNEALICFFTINRPPSSQRNDFEMEVRPKHRYQFAIITLIADVHITINVAIAR
jgi:hypothetical protein